MNIHNKKEIITILNTYPTFDLIIEQQKLSNQNTNCILLLKFVQKVINRILNISDKETRKIIKLKFFENKEISTISLSINLHISRTTVYNRINKFLHHIIYVLNPYLLNEVFYILTDLISYTK